MPDLDGVEHKYLDVGNEVMIHVVGPGPAAYIASDSNHAMQWPGVVFAARLGVEPIVVPGPHDSMLTHPDEVAKAILAA
jgi:hypothetical protein